MKTLWLFIILACSSLSSFCQNNSISKFIFVPHPRSEDRSQQSVLPAIEKIDFSKYEMILLGGDLTYYTSINKKSLEYCDNLFDLGSPNTLWTLGNHDLNNLALIDEFTGKPRFYPYYRENITFLVLDTELDAQGFNSTYTKGEQLEMVKSVCDTIAVSDYLVILHHRLIWMIGNDNFNTRIDSVGESTRQLNTTNFYQDVYPLLQKVKNRGIKVICLGGDKSKINIEYSQEDSITFLTSTMAPEFSDAENDIIILSYNKSEKEISWEFVPLDKVEKKNPDVVFSNPFENNSLVLRVWQTAGSEEITFQIRSGINENTLINLYSVMGILSQSFWLKTDEIKTLNMSKSGIIIIEAIIGNSRVTRKFVIQ